LLYDRYQATITAMIQRIDKSKRVPEQDNKQQQWWLSVIEVLIRQLRVYIYVF